MAGIYNATAQAKDEKPGKVNNAAIYDINSLIAAGINPKTGLPIRTGMAGDGVYKEAIKKNLRIIDEQDAVNRYK